MRIEEIRTGLAARLHARLPEIEQATLTRVYALSEPAESPDPEYAHGLQGAVRAALVYGVEALRRSEEGAPAIPAVLLAQARLAARGGVSLDTVLRRYLAGYTLLGDFVIEEAEKGGLLKGAALQRLLRAQAAVLDRLLAAVGEEYSRELQVRSGSKEERRAERVRRLLAGELLDTSDLGYELDAHHLGVIAIGSGATDALREVARTGDRRLFIVHHGDGTVWAWLGSRRCFEVDELDCIIARQWPAGTSLAFGEPGRGLAGWRLSHRQAQAVVPIALYGSERVVRYADAALLASMLCDDLLVTSLREMYLMPLDKGRDGGEALRETLRAYFVAGRNRASAAAALGVSRQTVANRLRTVEERVGAPLTASATELEAALRLEELRTHRRSPDLPGIQRV
jgi:hypothetical protein